MSFSENWEHAYQKSKQLSLWPWDDVVSIFHKIPFDKKVVDKIRILELGCGSGANIPFFMVQNCDFFAVDGSNDIIGKLKSKYPALESNLFAVDFSKSFGTDLKFDLIFDRAAITHNNSTSISTIIDRIKKQLKPGGFFMGIHWFADDNTYAKLGHEISEPSTRGGFVDGPYVGIEPVHFFTKEEIIDLFQDFDLIYMEHLKRVRNIHLDKTYDYTMWNIVFRLK